MKFYDETKPLYKETDASRVRRETALLKAREGTSCPEMRNIDNNILRLTAFPSNSLSAVQKDTVT